MTPIPTDDDRAEGGLVMKTPSVHNSRKTFESTHARRGVQNDGRAFDRSHELPVKARPGRQRDDEKIDNNESVDHQQIEVI